MADETWELSAIWTATLGLATEAEAAEKARAAGDQPSVAEAGGTLIELAHTAVKTAQAAGRQVGPEARAWLARAEAEWARLESRPDPDLWRSAVDAFGYGYVYEEARCRWRLAEALLATGRREDADEQALGSRDRGAVRGRAFAGRGRSARPKGASRCPGGHKE
jgi:hypothetical protein